MDLLIQVQDKEAPFLIALLKKFDFVKVKQADNSPVLEGLERSLKQMQAMRAGKLPKPDISELFNQDAETPDHRVDE
jgi:hypothetical protein